MPRSHVAFADDAPGQPEARAKSRQGPVGTGSEWSRGGNRRLAATRSKTTYGANILPRLAPRAGPKQMQQRGRPASQDACRRAPVRADALGGGGSALLVRQCTHTAAGRLPVQPPLGVNYQDILSDTVVRLPSRRQACERSVQGGSDGRGCKGRGPGGCKISGGGSSSVGESGSACARNRACASLGDRNVQALRGK